MHCGCELLFLVLAQALPVHGGPPPNVPRFLDATRERLDAEGAAVPVRPDRRLVPARRLADARPFPPFDGTESPRLTLEGVDVDGDGDPDRVVANSFGRARLFLNDGEGRFTEAPLCEGREVLCATRFLAFEDLDGDGTPELLVAAPSDPIGAALLAAKPPWRDGLARRIQVDAAAFVTGGVAVACSKEGRRDVTARLGLERLPPFRCGAVADLDGDGAPELVFFGGASDDLQAFWERVVPTFARIGADPAAAAAALGSLAAPAPPFPAPRLLARGADGRFAAVEAEFPSDLANFDVASVEATDFDGDGAVDLLLRGGPCDELRFLRNASREPAPAPNQVPVVTSAPPRFIVCAGVATPAPAVDLVAVSGAHLRLDARRTRPCLVVRLDAVTEAAGAAALTTEARALEGADVVVLEGAATDDVTTRARTVFALVSELLAGEAAAAPLLRIDANGFVDLVAGSVTLAQLRDFAGAPAGDVNPVDSRLDRARVALPRAERLARLPNLALAALTKLEAAGATGLDLEFGAALVDTRKYDEAAVRFAKVPPSPELAAALLELGRRLDRAKHDDTAKVVFERAIDVAPADPLARFELGRLLLRSNQRELVDLGTESLRVATYLEPEYADAQYAFGQGLAAVGRPDEAITALERALALEPTAVQSKPARELLESLRTRKKQ